MASFIQKVLFRRQKAHLLLAKLHYWQVHYQGWQDIRAAHAARKKTKK